MLGIACVLVSFVTLLSSSIYCMEEASVLQSYTRRVSARGHGLPVR